MKRNEIESKQIFIFCVTLFHIEARPLDKEIVIEPKLFSVP